LLAEKSRIKWHNKFKTEKHLDVFFGMEAWETKRFVEHKQRTTVCPKVSRALSPVAAEAKAIPPFCLLQSFQTLHKLCDVMAAWLPGDSSTQARDFASRRGRMKTLLKVELMKYRKAHN